MASAAACYAPLCVASQSNRICTSRMPSAERRLRRLPRLRLRLASRRRPRFVRGHCLSVFCSTADRRSVFAIRFAPRISAACCAMEVVQALPCTLGPPVAFRFALSRYTSCHSRSIIAALPRLSAAHKRGMLCKARRMCNEGLDDSDCANNWESARQCLKAKHCSQSVRQLSRSLLFSVLRYSRSQFSVCNSLCTAP